MTGSYLAGAPPITANTKKRNMTHTVVLLHQSLKLARLQIISLILKLITLISTIKHLDAPSLRATHLTALRKRSHPNLYTQLGGKMDTGSLNLTNMKQSPIKKIITIFLENQSR